VPHRRGAALAVIRNPFAGRYEPDIQGFMDDLRPLGLSMAGPTRSRAMARLRWSDRLASWSMARCGMRRAAMPCARC
jgi:hypothetical protein